MTQPAKAQEPSMEEILASIRRIISDDEAKPAAGAAAAAPAPAAPPQKTEVPKAEMSRPAAAPARPAMTGIPPSKIAPARPAPAPAPAAKNSQSEIDAMMASFDAPAAPAKAPEPEEDVFELTEQMAVPETPVFNKIEPDDDLEFAETPVAEIPAPRPAPQRTFIEREPVREAHDRHSAAERHRLAAYGPRAQQHAAGHSRPLRAHARQGRAVAAGHGPCRHRHPDGRRAPVDGAQEPGRRDMGREKFLERVWEWKAESGGMIFNQLKRLGASCDWSRERFTMDEGLSRAVLEVFVELLQAGPDLQGQAAGQLGPEAADRDLRPRSRADRGQGQSLAFRYPLEGKTSGRSGRRRPSSSTTRDHAARDDAGRHRRCRASGRRTLQERWSART
jgi:cell pole-organizing protein PopZ